MLVRFLNFHIDDNNEIYDKKKIFMKYFLLNKNEMNILKIY